MPRSTASPSADSSARTTSSDLHCLKAAAGRGSQLAARWRWLLAASDGDDKENADASVSTETATKAVVLPLMVAIINVKLRFKAKNTAVKLKTDLSKI